VNYAGMSERFVDGKIAEKTKADTAIGDAKTRMAWAENNEVAKDYPAEYKEASAAMQGAELAYANERYAPAAELAGEVSSILSDEFQAQVLAGREKRPPPTRPKPMPMRQKRPPSPSWTTLKRATTGLRATTPRTTIPICSPRVVPIWQKRSSPTTRATMPTLPRWPRKP
jgi:hypothetical protein